jgi:uncharacterized paraquat-inducible protein A
MRLFVMGVATLLMGSFPLIWFAPLFALKIDLKFWADATEFTIISTLQTLWRTDPALAVLVSFLALFAPMVKLLGLVLMHVGLLSARLLPALGLMGRLAMADIFLIALAVAMIKGMDGGTVTILWGFWAFAGAVLASVLLGWLRPEPR